MQVNKKKSKVVVHIKSFSKKIDNVYYHIVYDSNMKPLHDAFRFLNFELKNNSINYIYTNISALKLLFSYLELFNLNLDSLTKKDIDNLIVFLSGISSKGCLYSFDLKTLRSNSTINLYLSIYRKYIKFLGIENCYLTKKNDGTKLVFDAENEITHSFDTYESSVKQYKNDFTVPKYISVNDFRKILKVIRSDYSIREECIVRLMFESGLRLGEVLGLTDEDFTEEDNYSILTIRNRVSDEDYQQAKGCMTVKHRCKYLSEDYSTEKYGYQTVHISNDLSKLLVDYLNEFHVCSSKTFSNNYSKYTVADSVSDLDHDNFYIFINSIGRPLSSNLWGKTLREIFRKVGLKVDKVSKQNNLSHRFRHGYAMFMIQYKNVDRLKLKELLRHRRILSCEKYYRPTDEDVIKLREGYVKSIYDVIPELSIS